MEQLPYTYIQSERYLYTVGHYSPAGWIPESDHETTEAAAARVHYLNGGNDEKLKAERDALKAKIIQLADLIEGIADDDVDCPFCLVVGDRNHRPHCLVNVAIAAANEATP